MALEIKRLRIDEGDSLSSFEERPGVYFLYSGSELLYVGKSNNIKIRMCAHLGGLIAKTMSEKSLLRTRFRHIRGTKINFDVPNREFRDFSQVKFTVDYVEVLYMSNSSTKKVESYYIHEFKPPFNQAENKSFSEQIEKRNFYRALSNVINKNYDTKLQLINKEMDIAYMLDSLAEILAEEAS